MIATIRDYGLYPCPRCLIPKEDIFKIGREEDQCIREELRRVDTDEWQSQVTQARKNLYEKGYALTSEHVDGILKESSLVPTKVRRPSPLHFPLFSICTRMHFHRVYLSLGLTSPGCSRLTCYMNMSWVSRTQILVSQI